MKFGITLTLLGTVFLLDNLGIIPAVDWSIIWPIILIAVGLSLILESSRSK